MNRLTTESVAVSNISRVAAVVQAVMKKGNTIYGRTHVLYGYAVMAHSFLPAASDSRKNGIAAGY